MLMVLVTITTMSKSAGRQNYRCVCVFHHNNHHYRSGDAFLHILAPKSHSMQFLNNSGGILSKSVVVLHYLSLILDDTTYSHRNNNLKEDVQIVLETNRSLHSMEMKFSVMLVENDRSKQCFHVKGELKLLVQLGKTELSLLKRKIHHFHDNTLGFFVFLPIMGSLSILTLDNNQTFGLAADGSDRSNVTSMGLSWTPTSRNPTPAWLMIITPFDKQLEPDTR